MSVYDAPLVEVATRTLEEMCFFFSEPSLSDAQRDAAPEAAMSVRFVGPMSGRLVVRLCGGLLGRLATNMLGDTEDSPAMQRDALGEVANVVCGNVLPMIAGTGAQFLIQAAEPAVVLDRHAAVPDAAVQVGFANGGRADVYLYLDAA